MFIAGKDENKGKTKTYGWKILGFILKVSLKILNKAQASCADPESFIRGGPTFFCFFYEGREDPNTIIEGLDGGLVFTIH